MSWGRSSNSQRSTPLDASLRLRVDERLHDVFCLLSSPWVGWGCRTHFCPGCGSELAVRVRQGGDPRSRLLYAVAVGGLVLRGFNEQFYLNLNILTKATIFSVILYGLPGLRAGPWIARGRAASEGRHPRTPEGRVLE